MWKHKTSRHRLPTEWSTVTTADPNLEQALEDRIVSSAVAALEIFSIHLGRRLGLYRALDEGPMTAPDLAVTAGIDQRYAREWLEQQAVAGFVTVENADDAWDRRRYRLTEAPRAVFLTPDDPRHVSPLADMIGGVGQTIDAVAAAFRTGEGVPFVAYGEHLREGQGAINRPAFVHDLVSAWIGAVPGLADSVRRVADLGCGVGWSTIAMADQLPHAEVIGWDADPASIESAQRNAAEAAADVKFFAADAQHMAANGPFDLVTILEALHDMAQPAAVLRAAREALGPDGVLLVADENVPDYFTGPGDELERMMYGWSITHCLPAALAEEPSAGIGTVIRAPIVKELAAQAGFTSVERLGVDAGFFQLYLLRP
jgi:2-polyprenyl-3-methyl-5-hydroxy-6-metoxy-1,4-benzoquinol methylase